MSSVAMDMKPLHSARAYRSKRNEPVADSRTRLDKPRRFRQACSEGRRRPLCGLEPYWQTSRPSFFVPRRQTDAADGMLGRSCITAFCHRPRTHHARIRSRASRSRSARRRWARASTPQQLPQSTPTARLADVGDAWPSPQCRFRRRRLFESFELYPRTADKLDRTRPPDVYDASRRRRANRASARAATIDCRTGLRPRRQLGQARRDATGVPTDTTCSPLGEDAWRDLAAPLTAAALARQRPFPHRSPV